MRSAHYHSKKITHYNLIFIIYYPQPIPDMLPVIPNVLPIDIEIIERPYKQTIDVLRGHKYLTYVLDTSQRPESRCQICDNIARAQYLHIGKIAILLCDGCIIIRSGVKPIVSNVITTIHEIKTLHDRLPLLRNKANATFERLIYRKQLMRFNNHESTQCCVLCHCVPASPMYVRGHNLIIVCDGCCVRAYDTISIRVSKMWLGIHVIANMQQHDVYVSVVRLYMALLWDVCARMGN